MSKPKRVALYCRVSTDGQTTENQRRELRAAVERNGWTIAVEYIDHGISGAKGRKDRPQFDALLRAVARKEFDVVAAWSVDRLGRSLQDLVGFLSDLQSKKVDLYLHQQAWTRRHRRARRCSGCWACSPSSSGRSFRNG